MMPAGRRDRRITIERASVTRNELGDEIKTWTTWKIVWAEVRPLRGSERWQAMEVAAEQPIIFRLLYLPGLTVKDRIVFEARVHDIQSVNEIGRREGMEVVAVARAEPEEA